jgi:hypothetical protein
MTLPANQREGTPRSLAVTWAGVMFAPGAIITGMVAGGGESGPGFVYGFTGLIIALIARHQLLFGSRLLSPRGSKRCRSRNPCNACFGLGVELIHIADRSRN